jgi:hypothetical protein
VRKPDNHPRWDDEEARLEAEHEDREEFRKSLALADDEYLDDDEVDDLRRRQEAERYYERQRAQADQDREMFAMFNQRLRGSCI